MCHNMLRFPAISQGINGHPCKLLWLKSPPQEGDDGLRGRCRNQVLSPTPAKLPWAIWPKKEVSSLLPRPQALPGAQKHLAQMQAPT